ncbi:MAG: ribonuclease HIII [Planctomycetota bacterium]|nr:MAG: ribonuclease HIII [Planctomycetota bacterium]
MSAMETRVFPMDAAAGRCLSEALSQAGYAFRPAPYAQFQAQGDGVTVTLYTSGKLVVQGRELDAWTRRFLEPGAAPLQPGARPGDLPLALDAPALGSDEAGKGDTFGPLAVCAVAARPGDRALLEEAQVGDSKRMSDARVRALAALLRERLPCEERVLEPEEYNRRHAASGSVNRLLASLHLEVLSALHRRTGIRTALVDRFSDERPVTAAVRAAGIPVQVVEVPRAERHPAVAAASVLARDRFLEGMRALKEFAAVDLPLGSGAPVAPALRRALRIHGAAGLPRLAKLHFRNVQQALAELPWS